MSWLLLVPALGLAVPEREDPPQAGKELSVQALQGDWQPVKVLESGMPVKEKEVASVTFAFRGDQLVISEAGRQKESVTYTLDTKQTPAGIDLTIPKAQKTVRGIIQLKGDVLTLAFVKGPDGGDRPREFVSPPGSQVGLIELRRAKR